MSANSESDKVLSPEKITQLRAISLNYLTGALSLALIGAAILFLGSEVGFVFLSFSLFAGAFSFLYYPH